MCIFSLLRCGMCIVLSGPNITSLFCVWKRPMEKDLMHALTCVGPRNLCVWMNGWDRIVFICNSFHYHFLSWQPFFWCIPYDRSSHGTSSGRLVNSLVYRSAPSWRSITRRCRQLMTLWRLELVVRKPTAKLFILIVSTEEAGENEGNILSLTRKNSSCQILEL